MSVVDDKEAEDGRHAVYRLAHRLMALASTLPNLTNTTSASRAPLDTTHADTLDGSHVAPSSSFHMSERVEGADTKTPCDMSSQGSLRTTNPDVPNAPLVPYNLSSNTNASSDSIPASATNAGHTSHSMQGRGNTVSARASSESLESQGTEELRGQLEALRKEFLGRVSGVAVVRGEAGQRCGEPRPC
ncbi:hypothetical protein E2C01_042039 [Portunus trituberculatus]|uniref:Uncharacterized protein n=1 Tax=Portunus trituberculatus TaxID=210409 RepID=A0A5B7FLG6_PORTR|nr:hypothetical protein [Portunus trituberculatus]